ncbi:hypothetical protein TWF281_000048 [Arthrobotrys megalospora]
MPCKSFHSELMPLMGDEYTYLLLSFRSRPISTRWDRLVKHHQRQLRREDAKRTIPLPSSTAESPQNGAPLINRIRAQSRADIKPTIWKRLSFSFYRKLE